MSKISLAGSSLFVGVMEIIIRFSVLELGLFSYNRCLARLISKMVMVYSSSIEAIAFFM